MASLEEVKRHAAERRARQEYVPDPREVALEKARGYVKRAEEITESPGSNRAEWITAYATLALAELAVWK